MNNTTLTVAEIKELAEFAGFRLVNDPIPEDELEMEIVVARCPAQGVKDDDGKIYHHRLMAYYEDLPEEGVFPLGASLEKPHEWPDQFGITAIWTERLRQIGVEGWTSAHDDAHTKGELAMAAVCYAALAAFTQCRHLEGKPSEMFPPKTDSVWWPWAEEWWKPSDDPIRNLEKAGALLAAEIDRLKRRAARAGQTVQTTGQ